LLKPHAHRPDINDERSSLSLVLKCARSRGSQMLSRTLALRTLRIRVGPSIPLGHDASSHELLVHTLRDPIGGLALPCMILGREGRSG
jgi:hypothetical protein